MFVAPPFSFDFAVSRIFVDVGSTDVNVIDLYGAIRLARESEEGILYDRIADGSGRVELGGGTEVGLTVALVGSWQIEFPPGNYVARIAGGNLVGGPGGDPVAYTAGVQTLLIQSAASTVVNVSGGGGPSASSVADAVWAKELEPGFSAARELRVAAAAVAGKTSGGPAGFVARNLSDTANQVTGVADPDGNRDGVGYGS